MPPALRYALHPIFFSAVGTAAVLHSLIYYQVYIVRVFRLSFSAIAALEYPHQRMQRQITHLAEMPLRLACKPATR